jgi:hypothetical protein
MDNERILGKLSIIALGILTGTFSLFILRLMLTTYKGDISVPIFGLVIFLCLSWMWYITIVNLSKQKIILKVYKNLSIVGIMLKKRKKDVYRNIIIIYSGLIIYLLYSHITEEINYGISSSFILISCLLMLYENILNYRIKKGYYGNNEREAREIISFILDNYIEIDFKDGGKRKNIFSIDDLEKVIDHEWIPQATKV